MLEMQSVSNSHKCYLNAIFFPSPFVNFDSPMSLVVNYRLVLADTWQPLTGKTAGKIRFMLSPTTFTQCKLEMPIKLDGTLIYIQQRKMSLSRHHSMPESVSMD